MLPLTFSPFAFNCSATLSTSFLVGQYMIVAPISFTSFRSVDESICAMSTQALCDLLEADRN